MKKKDIKIVNSVIDKISILQTSNRKEDLIEARLYFDSLTDEQKDNVSNRQILFDMEKREKELNETPEKLEKKQVFQAIEKQIEATFFTVSKTNYTIEIKEKSIELCEELLKDNLEYKNVFILNEAKELIIKEKIEIQNRKLAKEFDQYINEIKTVNEDTIDEILEINLKILENEDVIQYMSNYSLLEQYLKEVEYILRAKELDELVLNYNPIKLEDENSFIMLYETVKSEPKAVLNYMQNYFLLESLFKELEKLKSDYNNRLLAEAIDKQINLLKETLYKNVTYESKKTTYDITKNLLVSINEDVYNLLTNKSLIVELDKKMDEIERINVALKRANRVVELINNLPTIIDIEVVDDIVYARNEYEKLNDHEKELVYNLELLIQIEQSLYESESAYMVVKEINNLSNISLNDEQIIHDIEIMYNELTNEEKQKVSNYQVLFEALKEIKRLKQIKVEIDTLVKIISNLTIEKKDIIEARYLYDNSSDEVRNNVKNIDRLVQLEKEIKSIDEASNFDKLIDELPYNITYEYYDEVKKLDDLYQSYDSLTKSYVKKYKSLNDYELKLKSYDSRIKEIIDDINKIGSVDITEGDDIARVKMKYELLDNSLKKHIINYDLLLVQERQFMKIHKENKIVLSYIDEQINLLIEISKVLDDKKKIELKNKIKEDYEKLVKEEKELVKNIKLLENI